MEVSGNIVRQEQSKQIDKRMRQGYENRKDGDRN